MHRRPAAALLAAWTAAACGVGPSQLAGPPAAAVAGPSCGPTDGPAVTIYLGVSPAAGAPPAPPHVRVAVWQPRERLAGRTWVLTDGAEGGAWRHPTATTFEIASRGTATVHRVAADGTIEGAVDLAFPSGVRVRQAFRAVWRPAANATPCG